MRIPQTRNGEFFPAILEPYQHSEKAMVLDLADAYYQGVSTRLMKMVTEQLMGKEFSSASISRFSATFDAELDAWREGSCTKEYPYVVVYTHHKSGRIDA